MKNLFKVFMFIREHKNKPRDARSIIRWYRDPIWWNKSKWSKLGCVFYHVIYTTPSDMARIVTYEKRWWYLSKSKKCILHPMDPHKTEEQTYKKF